MNSGPVQWEGKKVTVVGFARSGRAAAELLAGKKAEVFITDKRDDAVLKQDFENWSLRGRVAVEFGGHDRRRVQDSDVLVISPGVPGDAEVVLWAQEKKIPVWSEVELAWRFCPCPVIAVTGSNGKTTVTTLIARILKEAGRDVFLCGNIGIPFSRCVTDARPSSLVVLEISSFQLEFIDTFRPHIAVFLNFSQNHLDRHAGMEEYFEAKCRLFRNQTPQDFAVLNAADARLRAIAGTLGAQIVYFNRDDSSGGDMNPNFAAARTSAELLGVGEKSWQKVFSSFKGVEHRLEQVRRLQGVDFINDSKSTTVEAGRWALKSLGQPVLMIAGGKDKNSDFTVLRADVQKKVKGLFLIGQAREKIQQAFGDIVPCTGCGSLEEAVDKARQAARPGDAVLFSPMCASFDMFDNFEHRGRVFKDIVRSFH